MEDEDSANLLIEELNRQVLPFLTMQDCLTPTQRAVVEELQHEDAPESEFIDELEERLLNGSITSKECDTLADELEREMEARHERRIS